MSDRDKPRAVVREIDGQLVLDDPDALAMVRAVAKHNCRGLLELNLDRVAHFSRRIRDLKRTPRDVVIVIVNVDDPNGGPIADGLMPGHDWQAYRDRGEQPIARGLAGRRGIEGALNFIDRDASDKLRTDAYCRHADRMHVAVVVFDHGVAEVYSAEDELGLISTRTINR